MMTTTETVTITVSRGTAAAITTAMYERHIRMSAASHPRRVDAREPARIASERAQEQYREVLDALAEALHI